jgi:hypothetical protein
VTTRLTLAAAFLTLATCAPSQRNTGHERGTTPLSPLAQAEAQSLAAITAAHASGTWSAIAPTGSMEPILGSNAVAIYRPYDGRLKVGMVVVFWRDNDAPRVLHTVTALTPTHFMASGISNQHGDGWHPRSNISDVLVGVIYHERARP